jgi:uncharacterized membrane protein YgcG
VRRGWWIAALIAIATAAPATGEAPEDAAPGLAGDDAGVVERITDFASHIVVDRHGSLTVTESIDVVAAGEQIKRGIYRDFPTTYDGPLGTRVQVPFEIVRVERDGRPEPFHTRPQENGVRIYIGREDVEIPPGPHTYRLTYRTAEQLGFFADHDELYWNATGNGWAFPIARASASIVLPLDAGRERVTLEGYTGPSGSTEQALTTAVDPRSGVLRFTTTRTLGSYEGLTIVASFPKGYVREPTADERRAAWLRSNRHLVAGAAGLGVVLLYYLAVWLAVGRDPSRGTIIPLFEPPLGLDAAGLRYLRRMGYDERCFTAALVGLGVKGWLRLDEKDGEFTVRRGSSRQTPLSGPERRLNGALLGSVESVALVQRNHARIRAAIDALREGLALEYEGTMFRANRRWLWPGLALSVGALLAMGWYGPTAGAGSAAMAFIMVWLGVWTYACLSLLENVRRGWRHAVRPGIGAVSRVLAIVLAVIVTAFSLPFLAGELFGLFALTQITSPWSAPLLLMLAGVSWLFAVLLKQPTRAGQLVMDQIDGFGMYLSTAEGDALRQAPPRTPELFEKMLPFAIALDVEQAWSERFADILQAAAEGGKERSAGPRWYSGQSWHQVGATTFSSMVGASLSSAIASSSVAPGSRSGSGGGGSSGGGGGGGGGGGW